VTLAGGRPGRYAAIGVVAALITSACGPGTSSSTPTPAVSTISPAPSPVPPTIPPEPSPTPVLKKPVHRVRGWLHTVGTTLVDEGNHPVRLTSIGVPGMQQGAGLPKGTPGVCGGWKIPDPRAFVDIPRWGFNSVRVPMSWANLEPTPPTSAPGGKVVHHWNARYLEALDDIVAGFRKHGTAVILSMQQVRWSPAFTGIVLPNGVKLCGGYGMPTWLYPAGGGLSAIAPATASFFRNEGDVQERFAAAWRFIAKRYANDPMVVGADILNEPYDVLVTEYPGGTALRPRDLALTAFYTKVGRVIRKANPHLLLVFEDNKSRRTKLFALTARPHLANSIYSVHFYPSAWNDPRGKPLLERYFERAQNWGVPLWLGEFSAFYYTAPRGYGPNWESDLAAMLAYCKARDIGWTIWSYNGGRFLIKGTDEPKPKIVGLVKAGI
jgi:hypothetical protein